LISNLPRTLNAGLERFAHTRFFTLLLKPLPLLPEKTDFLPAFISRGFLLKF